jgi:hypothetical protein
VRPKGLGHTGNGDSDDLSRVRGLGDVCLGYSVLEFRQKAVSELRLNDREKFLFSAESLVNAAYRNARGLRNGCNRQRVRTALIEKTSPRCDDLAHSAPTARLGSERDNGRCQGSCRINGFSYAAFFSAISAVSFDSPWKRSTRNWQRIDIVYPNRDQVEMTTGEAVFTVQAYPKGSYQATFGGGAGACAWAYVFRAPHHAAGSAPVT